MPTTPHTHIRSSPARKRHVSEKSPGERVAAASTQDTAKDLEMQLNLLLSDAREANPDVSVNW
jgi:hypothetical protein